jgi:hypothetical protein
MSLMWLPPASMTRTLRGWKGAEGLRGGFMRSLSGYARYGVRRARAQAGSGRGEWGV